MTRFLKTITMSENEKLSHICAQYFKDEFGFKIVEYNLGNSFTGNIELLATDIQKVYLIIINSASFPDALFRSFMGYRWYQENRGFLKRMYPSEEINLNVPVELIILSPNFPPETHSMLKEICKVPVSLYKYMLFGSENNLDIYIEYINSYNSQEAVPVKEDLTSLRKELNIESAHLSDDEIREFQAVIMG